MTQDPRHHDANVPPAGAGGGGSGGRSDDLDALLRQWHKQNAERAAAGRESLMAKLRAESHAPGIAGKLELPPLIDDELEESLRARKTHPKRPGVTVVLRRFSMHRTWTAAAAAIILAAALPLILINRGSNQGAGGPLAMGPNSKGGGAAIQAASFEGYIMCPDGGRLDARDDDGNILGPCSLKHTDVNVDVSGFLTRVTLTQKYSNPHRSKIEAVYTFPLSERSAVDRMTMTIGSRVIEGQVKEKAEARRIYEEAKANNRIASLLEQERPNIFTQSIANIEPGADIDITISYVETTKQVGGVFEFDFPTTLTPRFIPGNPFTGDTPGGAPPPPRPSLARRHGLVLLAPATISELHAGDTTRGPLNEAQISNMLRRADPIRAVSPAANIWYSFRAAYPDGSAEFGTLYADGVGTLNGRWFCVPEGAIPGGPGADQLRADAGVAKEGGEPFARDTDRVPDASRITPMPATPGTRAGHDISITVNIDSGGPVLGAVTSALHDVITEKIGPRAKITLKNNADIPNRDFVLKWRQESRDVEPAVFTYTGDRGNFFAVQLVPPPAVNDDEVAAMAVPREIVFVLDVSGSMAGRPIEKAKEVLDKALSTLRPSDTFNIIKFSNDLTTLWPSPRRAAAENVMEARGFYNQNLGQGGTQMYPAIQAAYRAGGVNDASGRITGVTPLQLANLPADGREVTVDAPFDQTSVAVIDQGVQRLRPDVALWRLRAGPKVEIDMPLFTQVPSRNNAPRDAFYRFTGAWETLDGQRVFSVRRASIEPGTTTDPFRLIVFLTDGAIGNENEVIAEVQARQGRAAVFPFAIGNAPNRYLLDSMARFGRGEVEYVYETTSADEVIARFNQRIQTPVLTNIKVEFSPNLNVLDVMTALSGGGGGGGPNVSTIDAIPDLFDVKPLTIIGRYNQPAAGTVTISGMTSSGPYRRVINLDLPAPLAPEQLKAIEDARLALDRAEQGLPEPVRQGIRRDSIATLWARAKVESITGQDLRGVLAGNINPTLRNQIISLGESFNIVTQYTSFVAVDRLRVTVNGKPRLVHIPVELPAGTQFNGFFGGQPSWRDADDDRALLNRGEGLNYRFVPEHVAGQFAQWKAVPLDADAFVDVTGGQVLDRLGDLEPVVGDSAVGFEAGFQTRKSKLSAERGYENPSDRRLAPGETDYGRNRAIDPRLRQPPAASQPAPAAALSTGAPSTTPAAPGEPAKPSGAVNKPVDKAQTGNDQAASRGASGPAAGAPAPSDGEKRREKQRSVRLKKEEPAAAPKSDLADENALGKKNSESKQAAKDASPSPPPAPAKEVAESSRPAQNPVREDEYKSLGLETQRRQAETEGLTAAINAATTGDTTFSTLSTAVAKNDSAFVGFIESSVVPPQLAGVDPARTEDAAKLLQLYFTVQQPVAAEAPPADSARAEASDANPGTSHEATEERKPDQRGRQRVILAEHVIRRISVLAHEGKMEPAASLATALADALPNVPGAAELKRVFTDASVTADERIRVIDEQAAAATQRLEAILRDAKLRQRLAPDLLPFTQAQGLPVSFAAPYDGPWPEGAASIDGGILLSILVADPTDATRAALAAAGLRIESTDAQTRVIVGVAPLGKLADITLVDGVRKVEATKE